MSMQGQVQGHEGMTAQGPKSSARAHIRSCAEESGFQWCKQIENWTIMKEVTGINEAP